MLVFCVGGGEREDSGLFFKKLAEILKVFTFFLAKAS